MVCIKKEYMGYLKEMKEKKILQKQVNEADSSEYLRRLSTLIELERFIIQCEQFSTEPSAMISLKREDAVTYGLAKPLARIIGSI